MTFKKTEKEIIRTIVKYGGEVKSLAGLINKSHLLEKKGIAIIPDTTNRIFLKKSKYKEHDCKEPLGYIAEIVSLINYLIDNRLIVTIPFQETHPLLLGKERSEWGKQGVIIVNNGEGYITPENNYFNYFEDNQQAYWPCVGSESLLPIAKTLTSWFTVSQELKDLVKNDFKTEEQIRFEKQQRLTWISIIVAGCIGLASLIIGILSFF